MRGGQIAQVAQRPYGRPSRFNEKTIQALEHLLEGQGYRIDQIIPGNLQRMSRGYYRIAPFAFFCSMSSLVQVTGKLTSTNVFLDQYVVCLYV
mmetsp:Transcript_5403/g.19766  ORF Transcript_5403/g.19766 Transcript_5403/m.19766 type:complete len:93 (-) Transcript_5403:2103-2381(-)